MTEQSKGYPVDYWSWVDGEDGSVAISGHCQFGLKVTLTLKNAENALGVFSILQKGCRFHAIFPPPDRPEDIPST